MVTLSTSFMETSNVEIPRPLKIIIVDLIHLWLRSHYSQRTTEFLLTGIPDPVCSSHQRVLFRTDRPCSRRTTFQTRNLCPSVHHFRSQSMMLELEDCLILILRPRGLPRDHPSNLQSMETDVCLTSPCRHPPHQRQHQDW